MTKVGGFILLFIGIIVSLSLFTGGITGNVGLVTNTVSVANESLGATVVNGTAQYLVNYKSISDVVVYNETGNVVIGAGNYTITNNVIYNGQEAVKIVPDTTAALKSKWKISGTAQPLGYANESGTRAIVSLITVLSALAVVGFVIAKVYEDGGDVFK